MILFYCNALVGKRLIKMWISPIYPNDNRSELIFWFKLRNWLENDTKCPKYIEIQTISITLHEWMRSDTMTSNQWYIVWSYEDFLHHRIGSFRSLSSDHCFFSEFRINFLVKSLQHFNLEKLCKFLTNLRTIFKSNPCKISHPTNTSEISQVCSD